MLHYVYNLSVPLHWLFTQLLPTAGRQGLKKARFKPNKTNLGLFKISFLFILAHRAKMNRKLILKSILFVLFSANLTQLEVNSDPAVVWRHQGLTSSRTTASTRATSPGSRSPGDTRSRSRCWPLAVTYWSLGTWVSDDDIEVTCNYLSQSY